MNNKTLILASQSVRRAELLQQVNIPFKVFPSAFDEASVKKSKPSEYVKTLAYKKAEFIISQNKFDAYVLSADTVVVSGETILEKPRNQEEAKRFMKVLSGKIHEVYSGVCIYNPNTKAYKTDFVKTEVVMANLSEDEIHFYTSTNEPYDKAGGYGIQGIGARFIEKINGDYNNVVGLPIRKTIEILESEGFDIYQTLDE